MINIIKKLAVSWLRQLVADLSLQRPRLNPRPFHVGFVVDNVALETRFFFFLAVTFSTVNVSLPVIHMNTDVSNTLLLSEGQMCEAWVL